MKMPPSSDRGGFAGLGNNCRASVIGAGVYAAFRAGVKAVVEGYAGSADLALLL
jgi:hypothetical protein